MDIPGAVDRLHPPSPFIDRVQLVRRKVLSRLNASGPGCCAARAGRDPAMARDLEREIFGAWSGLRFGTPAAVATR